TVRERLRSDEPGPARGEAVGETTAADSARREAVGENISLRLPRRLFFWSAVTNPVVARSPDRATAADRRSPEAPKWRPSVQAGGTFRRPCHNGGGVVTRSDQRVKGSLPTMTPNRRRFLQASFLGGAAATLAPAVASASEADAPREGPVKQFELDEITITEL